MKEKVEELNVEVAEFGEEYQAEVKDSEVYLAKIRKLENLVPLNRVAHLEKVAQDLSNGLEVDQAAVFQKFYHDMKQSGTIPDEVSDAFGVKRGMKVEELMVEMGIKHGVTLKGICLLM